MTAASSNTPTPSIRIGLFGGSFDPIHNGHLAIARTATDQLALQSLYFIPAAQAPLKANTPGAAAAHRLAMTRLVATGDPRWQALDWEITQGGVNYTADTVERFLHEHPGCRYFWLLGDDQLLQLDRWHRPEYLAQHLEFAVYPRGDADADAKPPPPSPTTLPPGLRITRLDAPRLPISSTEIRHARAAGKSISALVPPAVEDYILKNHLYSAH